MALHNVLGQKGEDAACRYLLKNGYRIIARNWKSGKKELDIVALYNDELIIIEVKTRRNYKYGNPEDAVSQRKIRRIIASADAYLKLYHIDCNVRFDIIAIIGEKEPFNINHIINAFYPPIW